MALVVQKYGGTSVANIERIHNVAKRVIRSKEEGNDLVVILSAMAGETNRLIDMANEASDGNPAEREYDVLISTGEQVTVALLAMVLTKLGYPAKSCLGFQAPVLTEAMHKTARIRDVGTEQMLAELKAGTILVVAGFQGVDEAGNITTLGRGGSDTSAVAVAAALRADCCEIYTDVDGVYTTDPNVYDKARKLDRICYEEMLELASAGAKVLQHRSVELAKIYNVPLYVKSSFNYESGTLVTKEDKEMEREVVSGVTYDKDQAKITIVNVPDKPGIAARIFSPLSERGILVDMIIQNVSNEGFTDLTFTVSRKEMAEVLRILDKISGQIGAGRVEFDDKIAKVSIVGVGMKSHAGVASQMFSCLSKEGINILMISTSEIKISCVIESKYTELAVRVLHDSFGLEKERV